MEWIKNISASDVIMVLCGLCTLAYCVSQVAEKFFGSMEWYQKIRANKKKKEKEELKQLYDEFTDDFVEKYAEKVIDKIHKTDEAQNEKIDKLIISSNDLLRETIINIYYRYLPYKKIPAYRMQYFLKLYADYHGQGGNSFVDDIHQAVTSWTIVETEEEVKGEVKN